MKLEVKMFVRTKEGYICKILKLNEPLENDGYLDHNDINSCRIQEKNVVKASQNIIDLIEIGDYVNGNKVTKINVIFPINNVKCIECHQEDLSRGYEGVTFMYDNKDIKSIVTKEQFESMEYRLEK